MYSQTFITVPFQFCSINNELPCFFFFCYILRGKKWNSNFGPAFWVSSTQTLVIIHNIGRYLLVYYLYFKILDLRFKHFDFHFQVLIDVSRCFLQNFFFFLNGSTLASHNSIIVQKPEIKIEPETCINVSKTSGVMKTAACDPPRKLQCLMSM